MEFIVCSDNHGNKAVLDQILAQYPQAECFIHCGDNELSNEVMKPFVAVTGNNDYFHKYPEVLITQVGSMRILITHGHTLPFGNRVAALAQLAKKHDCTVACTGHTHVYMDKEVDGIRILNPGSLFYNRDGSKPCYMHITTDGHVIQSVTRIEI